MCKTERELLIPFHYLHRWGMKTAHPHLTWLACSLLTLPEGQGYRWASTAPPPQRHSLMGCKQLKEQRECAHKTHPNEDKRRDQRRRHHRWPCVPAARERIPGDEPDNDRHGGFAAQGTDGVIEIQDTFQPR
jgi:hypothetical protein